MPTALEMLVLCKSTPKLSLKVSISIVTLWVNFILLVQKNDDDGGDGDDDDLDCRHGCTDIVEHIEDPNRPSFPLNQIANHLKFIHSNESLTIFDIISIIIMRVGKRLTLLLKYSISFHLIPSCAYSSWGDDGEW